MAKIRPPHNTRRRRIGLLCALLAGQALLALVLYHSNYGGGGDAASRTTSHRDMDIADAPVPPVAVDNGVVADMPVANGGIDTGAAGAHSVNVNASRDASSADETPTRASNAPKRTKLTWPEASWAHGNGTPLHWAATHMGAFWPVLFTAGSHLQLLVLTEPMANCIGYNADHCHNVHYAEFAVVNGTWDWEESANRADWQRALASLSQSGNLLVTTTPNHVYVKYTDGAHRQYSALIMRTMEGTDHYYTGKSNQSDLGIDAYERAWLKVPLTMRKLVAENDTVASTVYVPADIGHFAWLYSKSRLLHCRADLQHKLAMEHPENYATTFLPNDTITNLAVFRDFLYAHKASAHLFAGTLLGWYRECGLVPYTEDLDMAAWAAEYSDALEKDFIKEKERFSLYWILGLPADSLELTVHTRGTKIDLFFLYEEADGRNGTWMGGMKVARREKIKFTYPRMAGSCSAQLLGRLFTVPCNVEQFLTADYGPQWHTPQHNRGWQWDRSPHNVRRNGRWDDALWHRVFRQFAGG